jgi:hypothetical protein
VCASAIGRRRTPLHEATRNGHADVVAALQRPTRTSFSSAVKAPSPAWRTTAVSPRVAMPAAPQAGAWKAKPLYCSDTGGSWKKSPQVITCRPPKGRALARTAREQFRALTATLPRVVPMGREATATATASSNATALGDTILDMTDPRVVALTAAMDRAGVQDSKIRATRIREALGKRAG